MEKNSFYSKNIEEIDGKLTSTKLLTNVDDISWEGIQNEVKLNLERQKNLKNMER